MSKIKSISAELSERLNWLVCLGDLFSSYKNNKNDQMKPTYKEKRSTYFLWASEIESFLMLLYSRPVISVKDLVTCSSTILSCDSKAS